MAGTIGCFPLLKNSLNKENFIFNSTTHSTKILQQQLSESNIITFKNYALIIENEQLIFFFF